MVRLFEAGTNVIDVPQKMIFTDNKGKTHILPTLTGKKHIISSHYGKKAIDPVYHTSNGKNILKIHKGNLVKIPKEPKAPKAPKVKKPKAIKAPKTPKVKRAYKRKSNLTVSTIPFATQQEILENNAIMEEQRASSYLNLAKQYEAKQRPKTKKILSLTDGSSMSSALVLSQSIPTASRVLAITNGPAKKRRGRPAGSKNKKKA